MPEKKKSKLSSVSTILITAVSAGFLAFSVVLFVLIYRYLSSGLESYFQGYLDEYSEVVVEHIFLRNYQVQKELLVHLIF